MARSTSQTRWRTLKRYALSGQADAARRILQKMLRDNPDDAKAAEELKRLEAGLPLLIEESPKEREQRLCQEAQQALLNAVETHTARTLATSRTQKLRALHKQLLEQLKMLNKHNMPIPQGTHAYKKMLEQELQRRRTRRRAAALRAAALLLGLLLLIGATALALRSRAASLAQQLRQAYKAGEWEKTEALLEAADTGINRLMHAGVEPLADEVRKWQHSVNLRSLELRRQMIVYENIEAIASLSIEERGSFLRKVRALPKPFSERLLAQWEDICRPEKEKIEKQKEAFLNELSEAGAPLSPCGDPSSDAPLYRDAKKRLQRSIIEFESAKDAFDLPADLIPPYKQRLEEISACLADAEQLSQLPGILNSARTYEQYRRFAAEFKPTSYTPALKAATACHALPEEDELYALRRHLRYKLPPVIEPHVLRAILEAGPSFCIEAPASREQVHLMEDIFSSRTLRRKLYEVSHPDGRTHYTEEPPTLTPQNTLAFHLSELDPHHSITRATKLEWEKPQLIRIRTLDAGEILRTTEIARATFFLKGNIAHLLGKLTAIHSDECPALAKAYVYHTLLKLQSMHRRQDMLGLHFAPTLRQDIASFRKLHDRLKFPLHVTCWLTRDPQALAAEEAYARWFAEHADRDYAAEMSRTLGDMLRERIEYIGYVDGQLEPRYKTPPAESDTLWYYSGGKLTASPANGELRKPDPFTPILKE